MLHLVNRSPSSPAALQACLRVSSPGDAILLIEDGVYCGKLPEAEFTGLFQLPDDITLYALETDVLARGIKAQMAGKIILIDFDRFVELTEQHSACQNWN